MTILYFEGAGSFDYHFKGQDVHFGDVGNCRIRTAFHVEDKAYYLEIISCERNKYNIKSSLYNWPVTGFVDIFAPIDEKTGEIDYGNCFNKPPIIPANAGVKRTPRSFEYSKERILKIVNDMTSADFDAIEVADEYSGFRVFADRVNRISQYHFGDEFIPNHKYEVLHKMAYEAILKKKKTVFGERFNYVTFYIESAASPYFIYRPSGKLYGAEKRVDVRTFNINDIEV